MERVISLSEMSLERKIAQMVIVNPNKIFDGRIVELGVGGYFMGKFGVFESAKENKEFIERYKEAHSIEPFFATDLEGAWNPFKNFYQSKTFADVKSGREARDLGREHGEVLETMGLNLNFSPVCDVRNRIWPPRTFKGSLDEISEKIEAYMEGLHRNGVLTTAKHYPGVSMIGDPHLRSYKARVYEEDLITFTRAIAARTDAVMIGHPIAYGAVDSKHKPATVSREVISNLRKKFNGLVITDAIAMLGLRGHYFFNFSRAYVNAMQAGNDIILDTINVPLLDFINLNLLNSSPYKAIKRRIRAVALAASEGKINKERINESVRRILQKKGYEVKS